MIEDDGTEPFGELGECLSLPASDWASLHNRADWDTPEWRAEMEAKYPID